MLAEEMLERGDELFVDELRSIAEPDRLGSFAFKWYADSRPTSRRLLFEYLQRPLDAFRHEALVKRLYKLAENAHDDELLAYFLVAFDRLLRRVKRTRFRYDWQTRESWYEDEITTVRGDVMPRVPLRISRHNLQFEALNERYTKGKRLFKPCTRRYLRRRVWRYFRQLGKKDPQRYLQAVVKILKLYRDDDTADGLALLDKWGLVHILFHGCPAIVAPSAGWNLAADHSLSELAPDPAFLSVWQASPQPLLDLLQRAQCRVVLQWTIQMIRAHHPGSVSSLPMGVLLQLIAHEDPDVASLASEGLLASPLLALLPIGQWLELLEIAHPQTLEFLCNVMQQTLAADALSLKQLVQLAGSRPLPIARLGLQWLQQRTPSSATDCEDLLLLAQADAEPVRTQAISWLQDVLSASPHFQSRWVLDLLDSRHRDVRQEAWKWFLKEQRASQDVSLWQRLLESPYDDVRLPLLEYLDFSGLQPGPAIERSKLDSRLVRFLWASVLLNIHRGSRHKPQVVRQIVNRLEHRPAEAGELLPILSVALRSIRGPEFRAGLAGVVGIVERNPELGPAVANAFPELQLY